MFGEHNTLNDLLTEEEFEQYTRNEYPLNLSILHNALKIKLKEDPTYEVWVPFVYVRNPKYMRQKNKPLHHAPHKVFISNKGRVCSVREGEPKLLGIVMGEHPYPRVCVPKGKGFDQYKLHRALACSFISMDAFLLANEGTDSAHPKDLEVNHIDAVKTNYDLDNLEWVTKLGNMSHAVEIGVMVNGIEDSQTKPIKGKVLGGPFKGHEFVLYGNSECWRLGFQQPNVSRCCNGKARSHKGCQWSFATEYEVKILPKGVTPDVLGSLNL